MSFLSNLERRFGRLAIRHLTIYLVFGQTCAYLLAITRPGQDGQISPILQHMALYPVLVLHGEVWRLFSFIFYPPTTGTIGLLDNPIFVFFDLYFFYFMGQALEANWGAFRYNIYLLIAYILTVAASFVSPEMAAPNFYIVASVFLAFAALFPEFVILLFLVLPVKVKWIAWLTWLFFIFALIIGGIQTRLLIAAAVINFLLFFGADILHHIKTGHRRLKHQAEKVQARDKPFHVCAVCGKTDKTDPKLDFRYCPLCAGSWGYCPEHLYHHQHKTAPPPQDG